MMKKNGPWTIKDTKIVYQNSWMKVVEDTVVRPDGKDGIYTTVDILPGVTVLVADKNRNVYLSQGFQYAVGKELLGATAGGAIDKNEDPLQAAKRELREETGFEAAIWTQLGEVHAITSGIISSSNHLFLAEDITNNNNSSDLNEISSLKKVSLEEAVKMVMEGLITHSASAVLILKSAHFLKI